MAKKISEIVSELLSVTGLDYVEVSWNDGAGGWVTKKWRPGTIANQNSDNVDISGGIIAGIADLAVADGGTGASDAATARQNLGVEIGVDVQAFLKHNFSATADPTVDDDSGDGYAVGSVWINTSSTPREAFRCVDATEGAAVWVNTSLEIGELGSMASQDAGSVNISGGIIAGIADLAVADGGTGASDAATARQNLGVEIGVDVQAFLKHNFSATADPTVDDDSGDGYAVGSVWINTSSTPREAFRCVDATEGAAVWVNTSLEIGELGSMASQDASNVNITGGIVTGITKIGFSSEYSNGSVSTNTEIDWANGNYQSATLGDSVTLTFANPVVGKLQLRVIQDGTGSRIPTLPSGKWEGGVAGTFSTSAGAIDILEIYFDGTNYYFTLTNGWA